VETSNGSVISGTAEAVQGVNSTRLAAAVPRSQCAEVAFVGNTVAARDSKNKPGPVLFFTNDQWRAFVKDDTITPR
jgi:hypothetical protein